MLMGLTTPQLSGHELETHNHDFASSRALGLRLFIINKIITHAGRPLVTYSSAACMQRACSVHASCMQRACSVHASCMHRACSVHALSLNMSPIINAKGRPANDQTLTIDNLSAASSYMYYQQQKPACNAQVSQ